VTRKWNAAPKYEGTAAERAALLTNHERLTMWSETDTDVIFIWDGDSWSQLGEENTFLKLDCSNDPLTGELAMTPSAVTSPQVILGITPSAAITTAGGEWDGFEVDGAALDPASVDMSVHGIHLDFSGMAVGSLPHLDGLLVDTPATYHTPYSHGLHVTGGGGIRLDHDETTVAAGQIHTAVDVVVLTAGATGGMVHALDVAEAGGGTVNVAAVGTHTGVAPIHQHVGAFAATDKAWRYVDIGPAWTDATAEFGGGVNLELFHADGDMVYISGPAAGTKFDEIDVTLDTVSPKNIHATYWFSIVGGAGWTQFYPGDDTDGFQQDGMIRFSSEDLTDWAQVNVNAEGVNRYWIRIVRTRNVLATGPIEATIKVLLATPYGWDDTGAVNILSLTAPTIVFNGVSTANSIVVPDNLADALHLIDAGGADDYLTFVTTDAQRVVVINEDGADIDTRIEASGVVDAVFVQGSDGQITLGALGVGVVQSTAGGVLSSDYTIDGTLTMATGLDIDPADASGQDLGNATHRWDLYTQEVYFGGATGANVITVPDNLADALHFVDAGGGDDYLTFVSTDAQRSTIFNLNQTDIDFRVATDGLGNALTVRGSDGNVGIGAVSGYKLEVSLDIESAFNPTTPGATWKGMRIVNADAVAESHAGIYLRSNTFDCGLFAVTAGGVNTGRLVLVSDSPAGATETITLQAGRVGIGGVTTPTAMMHVDQLSATGAIPPLLLDQADVSEEMIEFVSTIGIGNAIEAIGTKTLTITHFIKATIPGPLTRYIPVGTIA